MENAFFSISEYQEKGLLTNSEEECETTATASENGE